MIRGFVRLRHPEWLLHMRTAETLRNTLMNRSNIVITEVPYQVE